jgi:chemotaxis protein MotA
MLTIGGLLFLLACVFGSYILSGGSIEPLMHSLPHEMMAIGGAAIGTFLMSNDMHGVKHTLGGFLKVLKGARFKKVDYVEMLSLLFSFTRLASTKGAMALEAHIEKPAESSIFQHYPKILANQHVTELICDYLRMVGMNADDPHQTDDVMGRELKKIVHEEMHGAHALQSLADGLPALGIVAAVPGVERA